MVRRFGIAVLLATLVIIGAIRNARALTYAVPPTVRGLAPRSFDSDRVRREFDSLAAIGTRRAPFSSKAQGARERAQDVPELTAPATVRDPVPNLRLAATAGGPPWRAILGGVPGAASETLVRPGDSIGDFTVVDIGPESITLRWRDTTFTIRTERSTR